MLRRTRQVIGFRIARPTATENSTTSLASDGRRVSRAASSKPSKVLLRLKSVAESWSHRKEVTSSPNRTRTPAPFSNLLHHCVASDRRRRLQSIVAERIDQAERSHRIRRAGPTLEGSVHRLSARSWHLPRRREDTMLPNNVLRGVHTESPLGGRLRLPSVRDEDRIPRRTDSGRASTREGRGVHPERDRDRQENGGGQRKRVVRSRTERRKCSTSRPSRVF